ncbi:osmoregulated proline transporter OpuE [Caldalkalibacillus thermarum]|uniref:sodium:solute symporter family protein n=1 Tax=Caldalkalibacillus thermarum TaxID=296745 RepID=UPI00166D821C|nr:sodium:solute symporter family protein [Caldalkalibacillus thermarum]GGK35407.1 osmoregulated proline transporter OpuE [Caldalkalibacillus thermarum]
MTNLIFAIFLAFYMIVGGLIARYVKSKDDFYIMGERGSTLLIVGTLAATYLSAVTLLGIAGISYAEGPLVIATLGSFGAWIGTLLAVIYVGRKMKALGCRTMPDFFEQRFKNKAVSTIAVIIMIIGLLGYGVIQLIGAGLVLAEITNISFPMLIVLFTIALLIFCALGGMYGVVVTDTLMFFNMLAISVIIAPMIIGQSGFAQMKALADTIPFYWTLGGAEQRPLGWSISQFLVWILFFTCIPALVSRVFPAKNDFVLLKAAVIGVFFAPFMQVLVFIAAGAMQVLQPGITPTDRVMVVAFLDYVPPVLGGVGLAALMASIMSTASTLFVLTGFALARDLYENLFQNKLTEAESLRVGRYAQVIVAIVVCIIAIMRPSAIYWISIYAGAIFAVGWLPTIVAGLEWKRMNSKAAIVSMVAGVTSFISISELASRGIITLPVHIDALMIAVAISVVSLIVTAIVTKPTEHELNYYKHMKQTSLAKITIEQILAQPNGLNKLKKEYQSTLIIAITFVIIAVVIWGYFFVMLGL